MANHRSAEKRHRQSLKRQVRNKHVRSTVRGAVKRARAAAEAGADDAEQHFRLAEQTLRRAASKGVYHPKTVSRTVSRLHKARTTTQS